MDTRTRPPAFAEEKPLRLRAGRSAAPSMTEEALLATSAIPQDSNCGYGAPSSIVPQDRRIPTLSMLILGIHSGTHDACACLFEDYRLLSAVALERLTRRKIDGDRVPVEAIAECLTIAGATHAQVGAVVLGRGM